MLKINFFGFEHETQSRITQLLTCIMMKRGKKIISDTITEPHSYTLFSEEDIFFIVPESVVADLGGIEFSITLRKKIPRAHFIFLSANILSMPFILKSYIRPSGFFLFPDDFSDVLKLVNAIMDERMQSNDDNIKIEIISGYSRMFIPISKVLFFTASGKKILCCLENGEKYEFYSTLSKLEKQFSTYFLRCHSGFLVNREKILHVNLSKCAVTLTNCSEQIPISRKYKKVSFEHTPLRAQNYIGSLS
jgi:DNA-binding LytR/AlgR family response regulator